MDSTDAVARMEQIHKTSAVVTAAEGRLLTAASIMGTMLKSTKDSVTLRMEGDGPVGMLIAVSDGTGNVKGYVGNPIVEIPLNKQGKLDVSGAVGSEGFLYVIKDMGMKEPYIGQVPIISGEVAEDITNYYATSEQVPTVCGLGVLVNPDLTVSGGGRLPAAAAAGRGRGDHQPHRAKHQEAGAGFQHDPPGDDPAADRLPGAGRL